MKLLEVQHPRPHRRLRVWENFSQKRGFGAMQVLGRWFNSPCMFSWEISSSEFMWKGNLSGADFGSSKRVVAFYVFYNEEKSVRSAFRYFLSSSIGISVDLYILVIIWWWNPRNKYHHMYHVYYIYFMLVAYRFFECLNIQHWESRLCEPWINIYFPK